MSKLNDLVQTYVDEFENKLKIKVDKTLLTNIAKGLGPSLYNNDASKVSASDPKELETVKQNFLIKKLGLPNTSHLDQALQEIMDTMGTSNRNKYRAMVYYLLVIKFNKQSLFR